MNSIIQIKRNNVASAVPSSLAQGELAVNMVDRILYSSNGSVVFQLNATTAAPAGANTNVQFNDSGALGGSAGFTFNKTTNNVLVANALTVSSNTLTLGTSIIAGNGSTWLPNGLLMQWGWIFANTTVGSVTFATAFPVGIFSMVATSNATQVGTGGAAVFSMTTTTASVRTANATGSNVHWVAFGH
jgi:hypothetical protein